MKNLLSENMLRFGTKNLTESQQRELVVKSIMETINQHGLSNIIKRRLNEADVTPTTTAQPITIKSASGYQYKVTPSVDLIFRSSEILKIDFVNNTLKLGKVVYNIADIIKNKLHFGLVKNLIIAHGGPENPESAYAWKTHIPIVMNAIKLFATDKNIPDNIRKPFAECKFNLSAIGNRTGDLAELVNNWNPDNMAAYGIDNRGLNYNVDADQAKAIYWNLQQNAK